MIPVKVHLAPEQHTSLKAVAAAYHETVSAVVRRAVAEHLERSRPEGRLERLRCGRGLWKGRS
jgi:hypothetical protein